MSDTSAITYGLQGDTGTLNIEIDGSSTGTGHIGVNSLLDHRLNDGTWHDVLIVRDGTTLSIFVDGDAVRRGEASDRAIADLPSEKGLQFGRSLVYPYEPLFAPVADVADLRVYAGAAQPLWFKST